MKSKKWLWESLVYVHVRKHACPFCGQPLTVRRTKKTVNSYSDEAKNFDFSGPDGFLIGDVEFHFAVFVCVACSWEFRVQWLKAFERMR